MTVLRSLSKSIARKRNFVSAEVVHQKHHFVGNGALGRSDHAGPSRPCLRLWTQTPSPRVGPLSLAPPWPLWCLAFLPSVHPCPLAVVVCGLVLPRLMSQAAVQLASLTSLEDVVTHGLQSLLGRPQDLSRRSQSVSAPYLPRCRGLGRLLPTGLAAHPAQPARPRWPGCQELSSCHARALWLLPSPLRLPGICCRPWVCERRLPGPRFHRVHAPRRGCWPQCVSSISSLGLAC